VSYPRNAASPERVSIGAVVQISDGAVQTSGVAVKVIPFGGSEASGTGDVAYSADGVVLYTPVQSETDYTSFVLIASKAGCIPASTTVVTQASSTAGTVRVASVATDAIDAASLKTDAIAEIQNGLATPGDVSPTINFSPTIEPTELSAGSVSAIQSGLALESSVQSVITALSEGVELDSATSQKIDQILEDTSTTLPAQIAGIEGGGGGLTGPYTRTITVTDADTDEPIEGAKVRLYRTGETGTLATDVDGVASFTVEAATWSYAIAASGYAGASGTAVVSANGNTDVQLVANVITPPTTPGLSAIVVLCLDASGQPEPDVDVDIRIVTVPSGSTNIAYKGAKQTATSDADGIARFEVVQGSICEWKRGRADVWSRVTIDSDSVTNVTSVIGSP
jgi:hypothetical protein